MAASGDWSDCNERALRVRSFIPFVLFLVLVGSVAAGYWFTSVGMFAGTPDSIAYQGAASNIEAGRGLSTPFALLTEQASPYQQVSWGKSIPFSEQPPGYPLSLALTNAIGLGDEDGARAISIFGLAVLACAIAGAARVGFGRRAIPIAAISALVLLGPRSSTSNGLMGGPLPMTPAVLSERLALPLSLLALMTVAIRLPQVKSIAPETIDRLRLIAVSMIIFLSTMTRFTGFACGIACAAAIASDDRRTFRSRIVWASLLAAIGPITIVGISMIVDGAPKSLGWHPGPVIEPIIDVIGEWFLLPKSLPLSVRGTALLVLVVAPTIFAFARRGKSSDRRVMSIALGTFNMVYLCSVIFTTVALDAVVGINQRLLTPIQASVYLLLAIEVIELCNRRLPKFRQVSFAIISIAAVASSVSTIAQLSHSRAFWADLHQRQAEADARSPLHNIPVGTFVFTDDPPEAWNTAGLTAYKIPLQKVATTAKANPAYEEQIDQVVAITKANDSLVILSSDMKPQTDVDSFLTRGLTVLAQCPELTIIGRYGSAHALSVVRAPCTPPNPA